MKKIGFTLAEILIGLVIIGVVSSLTIPHFTISVQKKHWANALSAQVRNFENATRDIMTTESIIDLSESEVWQESSISSLKTSFKNKMKNIETEIDENFSEYYENKIFNIDKSLYDGSIENDDFITYKLKNNGALFITLILNKQFIDIGEEEALKRGLNFAKHMAYVIIDINGKNLPNTLGRDIFYFILGDDGKLYARGSNEEYLFTNNENHKWQKSCANNNKKGIFCTGRLVENNFVMDY